MTQWMSTVISMMYHMLRLLFLLHLRVPNLILVSTCDCPDASACTCPSTSSAPHPHVFKTATTSFNILRDIFTAHHCTHSRISVFHSDLETIKSVLTSHTVPHENLSLVQCRQALIHHLITGACVEHTSDVVPTSRLAFNMFRGCSRLFICCFNVRSCL